MRYNKGMDKYIDEPVAMKENGGVVIKAWVYENDEWLFRELTQEEIHAYIRLVNRDTG